MTTGEKRASNGNSVQRQRLKARAQGRALKLLARRHPAEYAELYQQFKEQLYREAGLS